MTSGAAFYGIGVGPGPQGLIPLAAVKALNIADVIVIPRARKSDSSVAYHCIADLGLPPEKFHEIVFSMDVERSQALQVYEEAAKTISEYLRQGKKVAYLTIGDSLTFSTYGYLLTSLKRLMPGVRIKTFPGVTSYATIASIVGWPLGQGKERVLILPCPESTQELIDELKRFEVVVLMKIGHRLPLLCEALRECPELEYVIGQRVGLADELISRDISDFVANGGAGYLTTMIIRRKQEVTE